MWAEDDRLLVGISGGADSVALALLALQSGLPVGLAHVNFKLRGEESDADEAFVRDFANKYQLPLFIKKANTRAEAATNRQSIQEAARHIRYIWWQELVVAEGFTRILTGHQADDQIETVLLFLLRGGVAKAFAGIPYKRDNICRPMLDINRDEIIQFLHGRGQDWREDSSNEKMDYLRNNVRHNLLPRLKELRPGMTGVISRNAAYHQEAMQAAEYTALLWKEKCFKQEEERFTLDCGEIRVLPYAGYLLHQWLEPLGFSVGQMDSILEAVQVGRTGGHFYSSEWEAVLHHQVLTGRKRQASPHDHNYEWTDMSQPLHTSLGVLSAEFHEDVPANPDTGDTHTIWVDAESLNHPMVLRSRQAGDRIKPLGLTGSKKVKDLLIEAGMSAFEKELVLVLCSGDHICWIPGLRMADHMRIRPDTKHSVLLRWTPTH